MSEWFLKEAEKFLDEARECGVNAFTITGGEPMLHRNFMDILTGIYERGMYVEEIMICPLSSRQVKYLKVSDKNTYISFWSVGIFMHTISLYIF